MKGDVRRAGVGVAAYGLNCMAADVCNEALTSGGFCALLELVRNQRLTGLLAKMSRDGVLLVSEAQATEIRDENERAMVLAVLLEQRLLDLVRLFDVNRIDFRILKGTASARLHYGDLSLRPFGDLDILVRAADLDRAIGLLEALGGRRRYAEPRPGYLRRFGKGAAVVLDEHTEVDLHRTISPGPFGMRFDPERFFDHPTYFAIGGRLITAPGLEERLLHACHHVVLGDRVPRLLALRDVAQILLRRPVDHERLVDMATETGGVAVVARAVSMTWRILGLESDSATANWAAAFTPTKEDARLLRHYSGAGRSSARLTMEAARSIGRPLDTMAFLYATVFPDSRNGLGYIDRWRAGARSLLCSVRIR